MNTTPTAFRPRLFRRARPLALLASLVLMLNGAPLRADEVDDVVNHNAASSPQESISWMSGGIGDDARDTMRRAAGAYNVHLVFSDRQGHYLAEVPFTVTRRDGRQLHSGISPGPLLYLKLPPSSYRIAAEIDGAWQDKTIRAGTSARPAKMSFVAKGE